MAEKGKEIAGTSTSKRKGEANDKSVARKRPRSGVLQFFEVAADVVEDEDEDDSDDEDELTRGKEIAGTSTSKPKGEANDKSVARKRPRSGVLQFFEVAADVVEDEDEDDNDDEDELTRDVVEHHVAADDVAADDVLGPPPIVERCIYIGDRVEVRIKTDNTMWAQGTIHQRDVILDCYEVYFWSSNLSGDALGNDNIFFIEDRVARIFGFDIRPCQPLGQSIKPWHYLEIDPRDYYFESWTAYCERVGFEIGDGTVIMGLGYGEIVYKENENATFELGEQVEFYDGKGVWKVGTIAYEDIFWGTGIPVEYIQYVCTDDETGSQSEPELRIIRKRQEWRNYAFRDY